MGSSTLPPGFRFHPTDEELVGYYLKRKVEGLEIELEVIPVIDFYKFDPWELPDKSFLPNRDMEWFFFCARDKKYPNGSRTNRATKAGYWKATGKDRKIVCHSSVSGYRKTLVFYKGRAPLGDRTEWIMHEYRLCDDLSQGSQNFKGAYALCHVVKKNEQKSKNATAANIPANQRFSDEQSSGSGENSGSSSLVASPYPYGTTPFQSFEPVSMAADSSSIWISPEFILDSSKDYPQIQEVASAYFPRYNFPISGNQWEEHQQVNFPASSSYSNVYEHIDRSGQPNYGENFRMEDGNYDYYDQSSSFNCFNPF